MSKLKCSYWDAFSLVIFWMKNNACPPPPNDNGKGEQRAEKRERGEKAGLEREEKKGGQPGVLGPKEKPSGYSWVFPMPQTSQIDEKNHQLRNTNWYNHKSPKKNLEMGSLP